MGARSDERRRARRRNAHVRFAAADRRDPAAGRTHGNQIPFPRAAKVRALVDRDRTRRHARVMRAQSKCTGRYRTSHRSSNHESCLGGRYGYPHGERYRPIGIERESDFDPNNLVLAPLRIVRPYPPTIRPDQHQAISRANQKNRGYTKRRKSFSRKARTSTRSDSPERIRSVLGEPEPWRRLPSGNPGASVSLSEISTHVLLSIAGTVGRSGANRTSD